MNMHKRKCVILKSKLNALKESLIHVHDMYLFRHRFSFLLVFLLTDLFPLFPCVFRDMLS